jgi:Domain of unknown function (DUF5916)
MAMSLPDGLRCLGVAAVIVASPVIVSAHPVSADATTRSPVRIRAVRAVSIIKIDGVLDEPAWSVPAASGFVQRDPNEGRPPTEATSLRIVYDSQAVYFGIRMLDRQPGRIGRRLSRRDDAPDADTVTVYLDPLHDGRSGAMFEVSAAGVQRDALIYNDSSLDVSWDGVWDSAVSVDERGWTAEIRIPFSQLRVPSDGAHDWGVNVVRFLHRNNESDWLALVPKSDTRLASGMADLAGIDVRGAVRTQVVPHAVMRDAPGPSGAVPGVLVGALGVDVVRNLTGSLAVAATANPDFAQVEGDPSQVNLTAFETALPERRPFFTESAPLFTNFGNAGGAFDAPVPQLFYSRRIGEAPPPAANVSPLSQPTATPILGAAKLSGAFAGAWKIAALDAVTGSTTASQATGAPAVQVAPAANYLAVRTQRATATGGVGVLVTSVTRHIAGEPSNGTLVPNDALVAGVDAYRFLGAGQSWVIGGQVSASRIAWTPVQPSTPSSTGSVAGAIDSVAGPVFRTMSAGGVHGPATPPGHGPPSATPANPPPFAGAPGAPEPTPPSEPPAPNEPSSPVVVSGTPPPSSLITPMAVNTGPSRTVDLTKGSLDGWSANLNLHRNRGALRANLDAWAISPGFEVNDLGYLPQADLQGLRADVSLSKFDPDTATRYRSIGVTKGWTRTFAGETQSDTLDVWGSATLLNYWSVNGDVAFWRQAFDATLTRGGPSVRTPAGRSWWGSMATDTRRPVFLDAGAYHSWSSVADRSTSMWMDVTLKPSDRVSVSVGPAADRTDASAQYVTTLPTTASGAAQYVFASLHATDLSLTAQVNVITSSRLSFQVYVQPFVARGHYTGFKALAAAGTDQYLRYGADIGTIAYDAATAQYEVSASATDTPQVFGNPDFNPATMDLRAVTRWEWRRGSTLYVIWTQDRSGLAGFTTTGPSALADAFRGAAANAVAMKVTYWMGR